jgi:hypothetical protein
MGEIEAGPVKKCVYPGRYVPGDDFKWFSQKVLDVHMFKNVGEI